jgi:hypothetical protein
VLAVLLRRAWRIRFRRAWRDKDLLVPTAITFSPFLLLGGQDYGGEAVLRVTLYSTIGSAAVLGPVLADALQGRLRRPPLHSVVRRRAVRRRRRVLVVVAATWLLVVTAASAGSTFNQWSWNILREEEVAAARWLAGRANATVIPLTLNWPGRAWADYEEFIKPRSREEEALNLILAEMLPADPYATASPIPLRPAQVVDAVRRNAAAPTFIVFSNSMRQFDAYYSVYEPGSYQDTLDSLATSPEWELVWQEGDVWVFQYTAPDWPVR